MTNRPRLTIAQVVEQFELSRATVRRGIESGKFSGAEKDVQGRWLVPVDSLVTSGIKPRKTWLNSVATPMSGEHAHELGQNDQMLATANEINMATERAHQDNELALRGSRIAQLETQLAAEQSLRKAAERNSEDLRTALRMIEAGATAPAAEDPSPSVSHQRRRWWQIR